MILIVFLGTEPAAKPTPRSTTSQVPSTSTSASGGSTPAVTTAAPGANSAAPGANAAAPGANSAAPGANVAASGTKISANGKKIGSPGSAEPSSTYLDDFRKEALDVSNSKRSLHNASPFQLDSSLNQQAQEYAEKLASIKNPSMHSGVKGQGENLAHKCSTNGKCICC